MRSWTGSFALNALCVPTAALAACRSHPSPVPVPVPVPVVADTQLARAEEQRVVTWSQGPLASATVPPGELRGVVVDAQTGEPLAYVQLFTPPGRTLATTDSSGRFRLPLPMGTEVVRARRIGYDPYSTESRLHADSGYVAVIALRRSLLPPCSVSVGGNYTPTPGVLVRVRDASSGTAPADVVTVTVRDGAFRDSVEVRADTAQRVWASAAPDRPGRYEVTVRSPGYRDWHGHGATRPVPECGIEFRSAVLHAWLIPE